MKNEIKWLIDPSCSEIAFKVKHRMILNVRGHFGKFDADIRTSDMSFMNTSIDFWIDSDSINTNNVERDEHLKKPDFFDVKNHKEITFSSDTILKADMDGKQEMWGKLSIKGITKVIELNVVFGGITQNSDGNERADFKIIGQINRKDWELNWNNALQSGGEMIGEIVEIVCEIHLIKSTNQDAIMILETSGDKKGN